MSTAVGSSAPSDAAASPATAESSRLEQPTDALAMESMPQASDDARNSADNVEKSQEPDTKKEAASHPESSTAPAAAAADDASKDTTHEESAAEPSSPKGKDNDKEEEGAATNPKPPMKARADSMAIGPAQDEIKAVTPGADDIGPVCNITLLLTSGSRHPYKISAKYLTRRSVAIPEETEDGLPDPFSISIYTLKELILREWRSDWEAAPASPSSIRLIHFGKLLDDKEPLKKYHFSPESPNVVHMNVRPQDLDEEEPKTGAKTASHGGADGTRQRSGGCCVVL